MTSFSEAAPHHSTAEEAARIALVAMHGALADQLPPDWDGPYTIKGETRSLPTSQAVIDYMMRIGPKPMRITAGWRAGHMEVELAAFGAAGGEDAAYASAWRSGQESTSDLMVGVLVLSPDEKASLVGGDAYTTATLDGIREYFLTYNLMNAFVLAPDLEVEGAPAPRQFKALRFEPHQGTSSVLLIDP
jgi:hypothetical protein